MTLIVLCLVLAFTIKRSITDSSTSLSSFENRILGSVNGSRAYEFGLQLENITLSHYSYRSGGSSGALEAAYWIKNKLEGFGINAGLEGFSFVSWNLLSKPTFIIDLDGNFNTKNDQINVESFESEHLSWHTMNGGVFSDLVILPLPPASDLSEIGLRPINMTEWNAVDTTSKIILTGREIRWSSDWEQVFVEKISAQPPLAVVYTWWYDWMAFTPIMHSSAGGKPLSTFGPYLWNNEIPAGSVKFEDGLNIRNLEKLTNVSAYVLIDSQIGLGTHYNVLGKIDGWESPNKYVIVSAHYDSVTCAGFCDNGAGSAGLLEIAKILADAVRNGTYIPRYTILFIAFTSEEFGLVGAINYIAQHKNEVPNIMAVINLDCIGSDSLRVTQTESIDGFDLDEIIARAASDLNIQISYEAPGGSDQEAFRNPSWADSFYSFYWGLNANISDATPVKSSAMLISYPLLYYDKWALGEPGWIHTSYDNSTTQNWVELDDLGNHIKVAVLALLRICPTFQILIEGPYYEEGVGEYWIITIPKRRPLRLISIYY